MDSHDFLNQRFNDLRTYLDLRFEGIEAQLDEVNDLTLRVEVIEKDITKVKAYWTSATIALGLVSHQLKDFLVNLLGSGGKP